jgi:glutamine amidotransferase
MIGIIDYGLGNINAFVNIFHRLHVPVKRLNAPADFEGVDRLILPGVGAFDHAMESFTRSGLRETTEDRVLRRNTPVIGICVGMQMLAGSSEEGRLPGLGWIPGVVKKFDETKIPFATRLPHMGWNDVEVDSRAQIFQEFPQLPRFYFLHSYYFDCADPGDAVAWSDYGGRFTCAVMRKNIYGVQFHPEKSHHFGVQLLENFSKL